jgi:hypothetical protein
VSRQSYRLQAVTVVARIPVASGDDGSSTELLHCSQEEDNGLFAESPPGFGDFLEILKTTLFCIVL